MWELRPLCWSYPAIQHCSHSFQNKVPCFDGRSLLELCFNCCTPAIFRYRCVNTFMRETVNRDKEIVWNIDICQIPMKIFYDIDHRQFYARLMGASNCHCRRRSAQIWSSILQVGNVTNWKFYDQGQMAGLIVLVPHRRNKIAIIRLLGGSVRNSAWELIVSRVEQAAGSEIRNSPHIKIGIIRIV
jgi:hypothetical protein